MMRWTNARLVGLFKPVMCCEHYCTEWLPRSWQSFFPPVALKDWHGFFFLSSDKRAVLLTKCGQEPYRVNSVVVREPYL
jgi:hypothetical protein